jgi:hypothetical protein
MTTENDRRESCRRQTIDEHGIERARVLPGREVALVNVSAGGALIETSHRLLPGSPVELHLATKERRVFVRGRVLRCAVARLGATAVSYHGAIGFDRLLPWFADERAVGYSVPASETHASPRSGGDATPLGV